MKNYYAILQVSYNATASEIQKAYRELAKKYHPDSNAGDTKFEEHFKIICEANEILSDPDKRTRYNLQLRQFQLRSQPQLKCTLSNAEFERLVQNLSNQYRRPRRRPF